MRKYEKLMIERFGEPISSEDMLMGPMMPGDQCPKCNLMPGVEAGCECNSVSLCERCGLSVDQCNCISADECPACGMMPINGSCDCFMNEGATTCDECGMSESMCECGMSEKG